MFELRLLIAAADPAAPALVGVSGGRDSVALLHALHARGFSALTVCHLDHALRPESAEESRFVTQMALRMGLPCVAERIDVAARAAEARVSLETAARDARYAFFARAARQSDCRRLFLAHHADDQTETFLFHLFRGSGAAGLGGIRPVAVREIEGISLEIIRPMLAVWRSEIDAYIAEHGLAYCEDASNAGSIPTRNRLRHHLIPLLEETFGRPIRRAVWRAAEILSAEDAFLDSLPELRDFPADEPVLAVARLAALPVALQRRALQRWLRGLGIANVGYEEVEAVRGLLSGGAPAKVNLPGGVHARRRAGRLFLERPAPEQEQIR